VERLVFVDQTSDSPTNRRLIEISRPTCCLVDQVAGQKMSSPPPVLGSIRPIRVNYITCTTQAQTSARLLESSRHRCLRHAAAVACVVPPPPLASRRRLKMSSSSDGKFSCSALLLLCSAEGALLLLLLCSAEGALLLLLLLLCSCSAQRRVLCSALALVLLS